MRANVSLRIGEPSALRRFATAFLATGVALLLGVSAARADDLLVLNGDSVTLSGNYQFGLVYIDGDMRLAGDTSIGASSIYIGPHAFLDTCFVNGVGDSGCASGRSLTLSSGGKLTVSSRIDLTGGTGSPRSGGNLRLSGNPVTVGGDITTAGESGGASGSVTITSGGGLSVGAVNAPSAPVSLSATGPIDVSGDIDTLGSSATSQPEPQRVQSAAPVTVSSSGGDVRIAGTINAQGRDAPSGGLSGGNGAPVSITGSSVRTGAIDVTGGGSAAGLGGFPSTITISARSALHAHGRPDASGSNSAAGDATPGNRITLSAGGPLTAAGGAHVDGASGPTGGSPGGVISATGAGLTSGDLTARGGNSPSSASPPLAGPGGSITVSSSGDAVLGSVLAPGGDASGAGLGGHGGSVSVTAGPGSISTADVQTRGGFTSSGPGIDAGPIVLSALGDLTVGGTLAANGSDANGSFDPPVGGGNGANVLLRGATGTLSIEGGASAAGGRGSDNPTSGHLGGPGGRGGRIDVVAHALGPITVISSAGGPGGSFGDTQGAGGSGGPIFAWTDGPLFDSQKVVTSDGGDGNPTGAAGLQRTDSSPIGLVQSGGTLSFNSRSPDAQGYRLLKTVAGGSAQTALQTGATTGLKPNVPMCVPVTFTVVAFDDAVGWTSDASPAVTYTRPPSATQRCQDAPRLGVASTQHRSLKKLRRNGWRAALQITTSGIGRLDASLEAATPARAKRPKNKRHKKRKHKTHAANRTVLATWSTQLARSGRLTLRLPLPKTARHTGTYVLALVTTSPDGAHHATKNLTLEIGP